MCYQIMHPLELVVVFFFFRIIPGTCTDSNHCQTWKHGIFIDLATVRRRCRRLYAMNFVCLVAAHSAQSGPIWAARYENKYSGGIYAFDLADLVDLADLADLADPTDLSSFILWGVMQTKRPLNDQTLLYLLHTVHSAHNTREILVCIKQKRDRRGTSLLWEQTTF